MNKYTPEQLDKIFNQVKELLMEPQYKLRAIELRGIIDHKYPREGEVSTLDIAEVNKRFVGLNNRIRLIEECLGIDFRMDKVEPEQTVLVDYIDYSFIKDSILREKVAAYYREMLRYQYATRNHKQCFGEFCRLAIIQVEFVLNYFFVDERYFELLKGDVDKMAVNKFNKAFDNWNNKKCRGNMPQKQDYINEMHNNKEDSVSKLNYSTKIKILCSNYLTDIYFRNYSITSISIWTSNMRNRKSHGSQSSITSYEEDYLTDEDKQNLERWEKELLEKVKQYNNANEEKISFEDKHLNAKTEVWNSVPDIQELYNKYSQLQ